MAPRRSPAPKAPSPTRFWRPKAPAAGAFSFERRALSDHEDETSGEELIDEEGRNPTQQQIDEEVDPGGEERKRWEETADEPHQGEEGQETV